MLQLLISHLGPHVRYPSTDIRKYKKMIYCFSYHLTVGDLQIAHDARCDKKLSQSCSVIRRLSSTADGVAVNKVMGSQAKFEDLSEKKYQV